MSETVHFCAGLAPDNGMAETARELAARECAAGEDSRVTDRPDAIRPGVGRVVVHGAWLPVLWRVARRAKAVGAFLEIRPHGSYDPVRLAYHAFRKRLAAPFERRMLARADRIVATCAAEAEWIRAYAPDVRAIEVVGLKAHFDLTAPVAWPRGQRLPLHVLYLGRRHPLKGIGFLVQAAAELADVELRVETAVFGDEKERMWTWCDVLCLPTLSENFGRVVAEALAHGKPVVVTDGAPAWADLAPEQGVYVRGYRAASAAERVRLLRTALARFL